jgi:hypothetical protein
MEFQIIGISKIWNFKNFGISKTFFLIKEIYKKTGFDIKTYLFILYKDRLEVSIKTGCGRTSTNVQ